MTTMRAVNRARSPRVGARPRRAGGGLPWAGARAIAAHAARQVEPQAVTLKDALGHRLACDLVAMTDLPVADLSAMDGWAVSGPGPWRLLAWTTNPRHTAM
jgi:molybdopterin molybdotransferase